MKHTLLALVFVAASFSACQTTRQCPTAPQDGKTCHTPKCSAHEKCPTTPGKCPMKKGA